MPELLSGFQKPEQRVVLSKMGGASGGLWTYGALLSVYCLPGPIPGLTVCLINAKYYELSVVVWPVELCIFVKVGDWRAACYLPVFR